jgi:hypothetical protein
MLGDGCLDVRPLRRLDDALAADVAKVAVVRVRERQQRWRRKDPRTHCSQESCTNGYVINEGADTSSYHTDCHMIATAHLFGRRSAA